jgi:protein-tyrosine-phosphatase
VAAVILAALAFRGLDTQGLPGRHEGMAQRLVLFVCSGNTSRSPMAQALCNDEILYRLGLSLERHDNLPLRAVSAGLTARIGRPLSVASQSALQQLGVSPHLHSSQEVTPEQVEQAERIFCMTEEECRSLVGPLAVADEDHRTAASALTDLGTEAILCPCLMPSPGMVALGHHTQPEDARSLSGGVGLIRQRGPPANDAREVRVVG